ncbi:hypothetical protein D1816_09650 [Aquimarina sp. AD10]|uniref:Uncharacterized protein n=1 Tax=Aquimarina aggregata TaxID=1642818 RepID=A0A162WYY1_9FLAO|nr:MULTISPECIES: hypothetical protein [Aquimarina]AXT60604.1 hypothetical protein D1816_09650 [Aquimarina sp. AD10]KZS38336.1 hypothetical protein AWE51_17415 [Aquimarina aggregata]RKN01697.1 hypothetical protein D7033_03515 [Aquimarina sp. AD10]
MVISNKIESYSIQIVSNYSGGGGYQMGFVYLYGEDLNYLGYLGIIKDGQSLPQNKLHSNGVMNIYFHENELQTILDTLRNELEVTLEFNSSSKWASLSTNKQLAGKGELAA